MKNIQRKTSYLIGTALIALNLVAPFKVLAKEDLKPKPRPNFLVVVADDLGFSDIGAFGGEISTPNLDNLAYNGLRLTGFHTAPTCSPTRSQLMTGTDHHLVGLGNMAELTAPNQKGLDGYEGYLRNDTVTLPEILSANGYRTLMSGKWHLGLKPEHDPTKRGFQKAFTLLQGAHNHFGKDNGKATYRENGNDVTSLPDDFYSSDFFADKLNKYLVETKAAEGDKPFFAYLTFTAPHWPLQARPEDIAKYRRKYDAGFEALRKQRLSNQKRLGLVPNNAIEHELVIGKKAQKWDELNETDKRKYIASQEVYAAMVDNLDKNIGKIIATLKSTGELDNTIIIFLADNGAEGSDFFLNPRSASTGNEEPFDNSAENIGKVNSYASLGAGWAQASTTPSYLYKAYASEGGTRATAFINFPGVKKQKQISHEFLSVQDILPTIIDAAGIPKPEGKFQDRNIVSIRGKSWLPYLQGKQKTVYSTTDAFGTELFGSRSIRKGDWKILAERGNSAWKLFNIAKDPGETKDLSLSNPEKLKELIKDWEEYVKNTNVILPSGSTYNP